VARPALRDHDHDDERSDPHCSRDNPHRARQARPLAASVDDIAHLTKLSTPGGDRILLPLRQQGVGRVVNKGPMSIANRRP
jgi:hypothetical protein